VHNKGEDAGQMYTAVAEVYPMLFTNKLKENGTVPTLQVF
jgi:hypothetical protein